MGDPAALRLASAVVLDEQGGSVTLGPLWAAAPAVVAFVRHFG